MALSISAGIRIWRSSPSTITSRAAAVATSAAVDAHLVHRRLFGRGDAVERHLLAPAEPRASASAAAAAATRSASAWAPSISSAGLRDRRVAPRLRHLAASPRLRPQARGFRKLGADALAVAVEDLAQRRPDLPAEHHHEDDEGDPDPGAG